MTYCASNPLISSDLTSLWSFQINFKLTPNILIIWIMLWPGTTALISHYRGSFTQAICCAGNSHNLQWLLVYAGKKNKTLLSVAPQSHSNFLLCCFLFLCMQNHFKGSCSNSTERLQSLQLWWLQLLFRRKCDSHQLFHHQTHSHSLVITTELLS